MAKHKNVIFPVTNIGKYPNYYSRTEDTKHLAIMCEDGSGTANGFKITRRHARLLAKRILQCLNATK